MLKNAYRRTKYEIQNPANRRMITIIAGCAVFQTALVAYARHDRTTR
jgi:hypothetical protein